MNEPTFNLDNLKNYQIVSKPCTAKVRVSSDVRYLTSDNYPRYLVNLYVIDKNNIDTVVKRVGNKTVNFSYVRDLFISGSIFADKISNEDELPRKYENVYASFDYVDGIMRCTHISPVAREVLPMVDLERLNLTQKLFSEVMADQNLLKQND